MPDAGPVFLLFSPLPGFSFTLGLKMIAILTHGKVKRFIFNKNVISPSPIVDESTAIRFASYSLAYRC